MRLSAVIKISESCNLDCRYCCQEGRLQPRQTMTMPTLERILNELQNVGDPPLSILWYGGEPTVVGVKAFEHYLLEAERRLEGKGLQHSLQSNGLLLDEAWADVLAAHRVRVRLSMDGPADLHDSMRPTLGGGKSHGRVLAALHRLQARQVPTRIACTVTQASLGRAKELVDYFASLGVGEIDFSPSLRIRDENLQAGIAGREYGEFLVDAMAAWMSLGETSLRIRSLAALLRKIQGKRPDYCKLEGDCGRVVTFGWDGKVYPCDEFSAQICLGHIDDAPLAQLLRTRPVAVLAQARGPECRSCRWEAVCPGAICPFERVMNGGHERASILCESWKLVLEHMTWGLGVNWSKN